MPSLIRMSASARICASLHSQLIPLHFSFEISLLLLFSPLFLFLRYFVIVLQADEFERNLCCIISGCSVPFYTNKACSLSLSHSATLFLVQGCKLPHPVVCSSISFSLSRSIPFQSVNLISPLPAQSYPATVHTVPRNPIFPSSPMFSLFRSLHPLASPIYVCIGISSMFIDVFLQQSSSASYHIRIDNCLMPDEGP